MSQNTKHVNFEINESLTAANAIIQRWTEKESNPKKVIEMVFNIDAESAADHLSRELYPLLNPLAIILENELQDLYLLLIEDNKDVFDQFEERLCRA